MRLRSLAVDSYGNFERLRLAFDPRPGCINLAVAPNGAGKSVLRQALHDLLFEIGLQSPMRFRHGYPNMNLQAEAVARDGAPLALGWSRKHKRTFGPGDGHQARLDAVLGHVTQQQARLLFSLDTAALREGGQELASGSGTLGAAMLSGTGELVSARAVRTALLQRRDGLWEKGRSSRPLNQAARAVTDARSLARDAVQAPRQRQVQTAEIVEYQRLRDQARAQLVVAQEQARRLARVDLTRPHLDDLATAELWLSENPAVPVLGEQLGDELAAARAAGVLAMAKLADAQEAHGRARDVVAAITLDQAALDKVGLEGERREMGEWVTALLRAIGTAISLDQASALLPPVAIVAQARTLIQQERALVAGLALARKRLWDAQTAHDALRAGPVAGPERSDAGELRRLLQEIRADRDPLRHAAVLAETLRQKQAAAAAALDRVAGWGGARHELNEGAALSESRFARLEEACRTAQAAANEANARRDRKAAECHGWQQDLDRLRVENLPDEAALAAARARRDEGWRLIHQPRLPDRGARPGRRGRLCRGRAPALGVRTRPAGGRRGGGPPDRRAGPREGGQPAQPPARRWRGRACGAEGRGGTDGVGAPPSAGRVGRRLHVAGAAWRRDDGGRPLGPQIPDGRPRGCPGRGSSAGGHAGVGRRPCRLGSAPVPATWRGGRQDAG